MITRAVAIATLVAAGFKGEPTLEAVKKFMLENAFEFPGNPDLDAIWKNTTTLKLPGDDEPTVGAKGRTVAAVNADIVDDAKKTDPASKTAMSPSAVRRAWERKDYDRRSARGEVVFGSSEEAEAFAAKTRLWTFGNRDYGCKQSDTEIAGKSLLSNSATGGGALTFDEFQPSLIRLVERYGAHRQLHPPTPMTGDTIYQPKETAGTTLYYPGQGNSITESTPTLQQVPAVAKEGFALVTASLSMVENSRIDAADYIAGRFAIDIAQDQESKYLKGDGSATYHNFTGWGPAISGVASNASISTSAATTWAALATTDFTNILGKAPGYVLSSPNAKWVMHSGFYYTVVVKLMAALSGNTMQMYATGAGASTVTPMLLGFPVVFAQTLPAVIDSTSTNPWYKTHCAFGDFTRGAIHGEVISGFQLASTVDRYFEYGMVGYRARIKWALSVHGVGTSSVAGPVILGKTT